MAGLFLLLACGGGGLAAAADGVEAAAHFICRAAVAANAWLSLELRRDLAGSDSTGDGGNDGDLDCDRLLLFLKNEVGFIGARTMVGVVLGEAVVAAVMVAADDDGWTKSAEAEISSGLLL